MLALISPEVGGVSTDQKTRHFNVMCAIHAIATAGAGTTPTVNPVNTSGTKNNSYNCITVISNTEAGGWSAGTSNFFTASATYSSSAGAQVLDLYRTTGKSTYPYYRMVLGCTSYPFNSSFTSYPGVDWYAGHGTSDPSTTTYSSDTNYSNGTNSWRSTDCETMTAPSTNLRFDVTGETFYVASTANYLIIVTPVCIWYYGIRSTAAWESSRTDNPPWVSMKMNYSNAGTYGQVGGSFSMSDHICAWSSGLYYDASQQLAPKKFGQYSNNASTCSVMGMGSSSGNGTYTGGYSSYSGSGYPAGGGSYINQYSCIRQPVMIFSSMWGTSGITQYTYAPPIEGATIDPNTGLTVPGAYPITIHGYYNYYGWSGTLPGLYKGMNGQRSYLATVASASSYTIGSDSWVPVFSLNKTQGDLFFLRSA